MGFFNNKTPEYVYDPVIIKAATILKEAGHHYVENNHGDDEKNSCNYLYYNNYGLYIKVEGNTWTFEKPDIDVNKPKGIVISFEKQEVFNDGCIPKEKFNNHGNWERLVNFLYDNLKTVIKEERLQDKIRKIESNISSIIIEKSPTDFSDWQAIRPALWIKRVNNLYYVKYGHTIVYISKAIIGEQIDEPILIEGDWENILTAELNSIKQSRENAKNEAIRKAQREQNNRIDKYILDFKKKNS